MTCYGVISGEPQNVGGNAQPVVASRHWRKQTAWNVMVMVGHRRHPAAGLPALDVWQWPERHRRRPAAPNRPARSLDASSRDF